MHEEEKMSNGLSKAAKKFDFASFAKAGAPQISESKSIKQLEESKVPTFGEARTPI